jgi:hypothetical protein
MNYRSKFLNLQVFLNLGKTLFLNHIKPILFLILLFISLEVFSQTPPPPPDGGGGPGTVNDIPINFIVYPLMLIGAYLGYRVFSKRL